MKSYHAGIVPKTPLHDTQLNLPPRQFLRFCFYLCILQTGILTLQFDTQIGIIDDRDECEWVNVSSGTAHPGCPGQIPQSRKTVVCV